MNIEDFMSDDGPPPDRNTQWVACGMVNLMLEKLAIGLVVQFATFVPPDPIDGGPTADDIIDQLLASVISEAVLENETDLPPDAFDLDAAKRLALDMLDTHIGNIRRIGLQR